MTVCQVVSVCMLWCLSGGQRTSSESRLCWYHMALGLTLGGQIQQQALLLCEHITDLFYLIYLYLLL